MPGKIDVSFNVDLTEQRFEKFLNNEIQKFVNKKMNEILPLLLIDIQQLIMQGIKNSPEYVELTTNGSPGKPTLREELGIPSPVSSIDAIINSIIGAMKFEVLAPTENSAGGLYIGAFYEDYSEAINSIGASYPNTGKRGGIIRWLEWLLKSGTGVIIQGYELLYDYPNRKISSRSSSRTGKAIMIKRNYHGENPPKNNKNIHTSQYNLRFGRTGPSSWAMPSSYAGTEENNWFTKVMESISPQVQKVLEERVNSIFN